MNSTNVATALSKNALFSMDIKVHGRSSGADITKLMAYRGGCRMRSELTGKWHSYTRKAAEVVHSEVQLPTLAPPEWSDRPQLAIAIDAAETRVSAQLVRELMLGLPRQLDLEAQIDLMHRWIDEFFVRHGVVASWDIHDKPGNPHVHLLLSMREATPTGFGFKVRKWNDRRLVELCRASYARACNRALRAIGSEMRMNHRSFKRRRLDVTPTIHLGPRLPLTEDAWQSKKIQNDYILAQRPIDIDGHGGGGDGDGTDGGAPDTGCPIVRSDRVVDQSGVDSPPPGNRGSVARPRRRGKKAKDGQKVDGWGGSEVRAFTSTHN
jgi:hypothetical protein